MIEQNDSFACYGVREREGGRGHILGMRAYSRKASVKQTFYYLVHAEVPLQDLDLVQSLLERRMIPGGRDELESVL